MNQDPKDIAELHRDLVRFMRDIASGSPGVVQPGTPSERPCALCLAHINHAREALGFEEWPAIPATEKGKL